MYFIINVLLNYLYSLKSVKMKVLVAQPCLTVCDPMDSSPPGSSVHGILQARTLGWVAMPFSGWSSWPRWQPTPVVLLGKFHRQRNFVAGYSPWGSKESDMTEHTMYFWTFFQNPGKRIQFRHSTLSPSFPDKPRLFPWVSMERSSDNKPSEAIHFGLHP